MNVGVNLELVRWFLLDEQCPRKGWLGDPAVLAPCVLIGVEVKLAEMVGSAGARRCLSMLLVS